MILDGVYCTMYIYNNFKTVKYYVALFSVTSIEQLSLAEFRDE